METPTTPPAQEIVEPQPSQQDIIETAPVQENSTPSTLPPTTPGKQSNAIKILLVGLALILFGVLAGILAARFIPMSGSLEQTPITPTVTITTTPTVTVSVTPTSVATPTATPSISKTSPTPSAVSKDWNLLTVKSILGLAGYKFSYPTGWVLKTSPTVTNKGLLVIEKEKVSLQILAGVQGSAPCQYPEDQEIDNALKYTSYKEIAKTPTIGWRSALYESGSVNRTNPTYDVCETVSGGKYTTLTKIGTISLSGQTISDLVLADFDNILQKIEIAE